MRFGNSNWVIDNFSRSGLKIELNGKRVSITAGGAGMGRATALAMAKLGAEEITDMICFLCSDFGRHVSGQIIGVDGYTETLYPRS
jgi:NAD(P)-dependent dehydrogenase (short-subunit alcohol dehydrogenase family)